MGKKNRSATLSGLEDLISEGGLGDLGNLTEKKEETKGEPPVPKVHEKKEMSSSKEVHIENEENKGDTVEDGGMEDFIELVKLDDFVGQNIEYLDNDASKILEQLKVVFSTFSNKKRGVTKKAILSTIVKWFASYHKGELRKMEGKALNKTRQFQ